MYTPLPPRQPDYAVLLADDDGGVREFVSVIMRQLGVLHYITASGLEAVALYRRYHPPVTHIFLDIQMPDLDGPMTLAALRDLNLVVPCWFMSGGFYPYTEPELLRLGALGVLHKPFPPTAIQEALAGYTTLDHE